MRESICLPRAFVRQPKPNRWAKISGSTAYLRTTALVIASLVSIPIVLIPVSFTHPEPQIWRHIVDTMLGDLVRNTLMLSIGVLTGTLVLGVAAAWLTAVCDYPGRRIFDWAFILPLAMPTYVLAFVFVGLFDFAGPVQTMLRSRIPGNLAWFPDIRSTGGVILVMTLALYPYVYLLARSAFATQGKNALEVCQACGYSRAGAFFKAALPMARPWIAGGLMLVLMETLADFGAVSIFNYDTFTTGIYKAWFGFFSLSAAAQLSSVLLAIVLVMVILEHRIRAKMRFNPVGRTSANTDRIRLSGWRKWSAFGFSIALLSAAFVLPGIQLLRWSFESLSMELSAGYLTLLASSLFFSGSAAAVVTGLGLLLAYVRRNDRGWAATCAVRIATLGYALPGTVLAVGVVMMVGFADRQIFRIAAEFIEIRPGPIFSGTILTVIFAYTVRFLTAGFNSINNSMLRITRSLDEAAQLLGVTGIRLLGKVHVPILRNGIYTAAMLVFVDVMKEMPITLMTRPFGWDTLAVKIFELTSEGEWQRAALPSIVLLLAGLIPLILLHRKSRHSLF